jgi:hypothetical protein
MLAYYHGAVVDGDLIPYAVTVTLISSTDTYESAKPLNVQLILLESSDSTLLPTPSRTRTATSSSSRSPTEMFFLTPATTSVRTSSYQAPPEDRAMALFPLPSSPPLTVCSFCSPSPLYGCRSPNHWNITDRYRRL